MSAKRKSGRCVVIGGGMAGLSAARTISDGGLEVVVLEKEKEIGGRMSTVSFAGGVFDNGAQFFTVKDERFQPLVEAWKQHGVVQDWFHSQLIRGGASNPDGHPRYCGIHGMHSLLQDLAQGLDIQTGQEVTKIAKKGSGYELMLADGSKIVAESVILTAPVPKALELLDVSGLTFAKNDLEHLQDVTYTSCLTLMAVLDAPKSGLTEWGGLRIQGEYIDWIADNHLKGISDTCAITIQAMPEFSEDHWDEDDEEIAKRLLDNAKALLLAEVKAWQLHRWQYAKPKKVHPFSHVAVHGAPRLLLAGDGFQGYRVEGAAISGMEAGQSILRQFS